jgi:hypothetical protein
LTAILAYLLGKLKQKRKRKMVTTTRQAVASGTTRPAEVGTRGLGGNSSLRRSVMRLLAAALAAGLAAGLYAAGDKEEKKEVKPTEAFKEWADYFVGGVWTTTNAKGKAEEIRYEWILDKSFVRLAWKTEGESGEEIHGIDPATGRWTYWGFDSKGRVYKGAVTSAKAGEWSYVNSGQGKDGPNSLKGKDVRLGPDEERFEIHERILDGKKQPPEDQIWKRKK